MLHQFVVVLVVDFCLIVVRRVLVVMAVGGGASIPLVVHMFIMAGDRNV